VTQAADRAYSALRAGILTGRHGFGERLGEIEIAAELGLSRTPVREALRRLGSEGLVEVLPNRGARVRTWTAQDLEESYELRAVLEGLAARRAAARVEPAVLAEMDDLAERMVAVDPSLGHRPAGDFDELALARSHAHHREIVDALRAGDGAWAESVMRSHVLAARAVLLTSYRALGEAS
jgi:DNA-binding GntR family transcriptional regulator